MNPFELPSNSSSQSSKSSASNLLRTDDDEDDADDGPEDDRDDRTMCSHKWAHPGKSGGSRNCPALPMLSAAQHRLIPPSWTSKTRSPLGRMTCLYSRRLENGGDIDSRAESSSTIVAVPELKLVVAVVSAALARAGDDAVVVIRSADAMASVCCCRNSLRFGDLDGGAEVEDASSACAPRQILLENDGNATRLPLVLLLVLLVILVVLLGPTNVSAVAGVLAQPPRQRPAAADDDEETATAAAARPLVTRGLLLLID